MNRFTPILTAIIVLALASFAVAQKQVTPANATTSVKAPSGPAIFPL